MTPRGLCHKDLRVGMTRKASIQWIIIWCYQRLA